MTGIESERSRDEALIERERNVARYFVQTRSVAWILLILTLVWGVVAYQRIPKAKDPLVPVRTAVAVCRWPGASAEKVEQLITRKIEEKLAEHAMVEKVESISRTGVAIVYVTVSETLADRDRVFDDLYGKLASIRDLPSAASPVEFIKDFGDTSALLLTVASPKVSEVEIAVRARSIERAIRAGRRGETGRATLVIAYPAGMNDSALRAAAEPAVSWFDALGDRDGRVIAGPGFVGIDLVPTHDDASLLESLRKYGARNLQLSELHPDVWPSVVIRDPSQALARLSGVAGDRYTYRELDQYSELITRHLQNLPLVSKVTRSGTLPEAIYLDYSQQRLAAYGLRSPLEEVLSARNVNLPGGTIEAEDRTVAIEPSGELTSEQELGAVLVPVAAGAPVQLRDLAKVTREYQSPAQMLVYSSARDTRGNIVRLRAVTLGIQMRPGSQIADFGEQVDRKLRELQDLLPEGLVLRRTSDQPLQVRENIGLFMNSLYEAIALVVLVTAIGFWEWRSALIMALVIPITLAMTLGLMLAIGVDLHQVSIAALVLALGLLVDDPVVAGDAIKRSQQAGHSRLVSAWLGPTKLATAILFATCTNIVAYLPFLVLTGDIGRFIWTLPVVMTCSLVASRIVSMTFVPLLGYALLRAVPRLDATRGPTLLERGYRRCMHACIEHRYLALAASLVLLATGFAFARGLGTAFFPRDNAYLSYVDVWLPADAPISATRAKAAEADAIIREVATAYGQDEAREGKPREVLEAITWFVGGGAPRFWFSVAPELPQPNYAQLLIQLRDKHDTKRLVPRLQQALSSRIAGARFDVRELETAKRVGVPVAVRVSGDDAAELRRQAELVKAVLRAEVTADRVRDDWGGQSLFVPLEVDSDRANLAGITNRDVASSSSTAMSGRRVSQLREGNRVIPVVARLRSSERAQLSDIQNLYVFPRDGGPRVPVRQVSQLGLAQEAAVIRRYNQFRTITVSCFPVAGVLPSQVVERVESKLQSLAKQLPAGYRLTIAGEQEDRHKGFAQLRLVLAISVVGIFLALLIQFRSAIKPLLVFAAIPYGIAAALVSLRVMDSPFGFMAFLGIISLIGVIVSHIIVLFDFIEERRSEGASLTAALLDAGVVRLRPVLVTVAATVFALVPLAQHGGPLWEPLCYAQIGGLTCATAVTLFLVPVLYTIAARDLRWIDWPVASGEVPPTVLDPATRLSTEVRKQRLESAR